MSRWTNHYNRPISQEEQHLYDHLLSLSQAEVPAQLIERFRKLFIEAIGYPDEAVQAAIEQIVAADANRGEFSFILNRCCHILINRWQMYPRLQGSVWDLISVFESVPSAPPYSRSAKHLRELVREFVETEQYLTLRRLATVLRQDNEATIQSKPLGSYIRRYPYLYEHCLLVEESSDEQRRTVRRIRARAQKQFELDLSRYITHQIVRSSHPTRSKPVKQVTNPTLLSEKELQFAIKQFGGKVDGQNTQRDLAQQFLTYSNQAPSYRVFKEDLYGYLIKDVDPEYGRYQFFDRLYNHLHDTLPQNDDQKPDDFLLMRTCGKLINFLVVENSQTPNHAIFLDLVTNIGTTLTVNLLLKIVLLCRKMKFYLEKRFSILFSHYEGYTKDSGIGWLIEALENLNVAFATNFGSVNCSGIS